MAVSPPQAPSVETIATTTTATTTAAMARGSPVTDLGRLHDLCSICICSPHTDGNGSSPRTIASVHCIDTALEGLCSCRGCATDVGFFFPGDWQCRDRRCRGLCGCGLEGSLSTVNVASQSTANAKSSADSGASASTSATRGPNGTGTQSQQRRSFASQRHCRSSDRQQQPTWRWRWDCGFEIGAVFLSSAALRAGGCSFVSEFHAFSGSRSCAAVVAATGSSDFS